MKPRSTRRRATVPLLLALAAVSVTVLFVIRSPSMPHEVHMVRQAEIRQAETATHTALQTHTAPTLKPLVGEGVAGTIFVAISSYRDDECSETVQHMYDMADVPERVFVGVCEQNWKAPQESCMHGHLPLRLRDNVKFITVNASEAKGPTYGRALSQNLFAGQDYYMQIDSHMKFAPGWDVRMVAMYEKLRRCNPKSVLSHYPPADEDLNDKEVPRICNCTWLEDVGIYRLWEAENQLPLGQFVPTPFAAGGFMFFSGKVLDEVPFDPLLPYLFDGEEILYSMRLWTHGWDIFTPIENLIFHHYERKKGKSVYSDHEDTWYDNEQNTLTKVRYLMGISDQRPNATLSQGLDRYGMGDVRSVRDYYAFADIDIASNTSHSAAKFCGRENGYPPNKCLKSISLPITETSDEVESEQWEDTSEEQERDDASEEEGSADNAYMTDGDAEVYTDSDEEAQQQQQHPQAAAQVQVEADPADKPLSEQHQHGSSAEIVEQ